MSREYDCNASLAQKVLKGANVLADNVATTLGPRGRNVILQEKGKPPFVSKDGVTVARFVELEDPFENAGAQIIKQAAIQTNSDAGDGTTTSTVLARSILQHSQRYLTAGVSPVELKRGMDRAVSTITSRLDELSRPIMSAEDIEHIATISANNDGTIGKLISTAVDRVGKDGAITIEEARSTETSLDLTEGFQLSAGYCAGAFITDDRRGIMHYDDPYIMVTDYKLDSVEPILPVLEIVAREGKPLIIVAEEVEGQALAALIMNAARGTLKIAAIKAPRYGEERRNIMKDLAASVGATFVNRASGLKLKDVKLENFGKAKSIDSTNVFTTIVGGTGDHEEIDKRIQSLKEELNRTDNINECERLQERVTRLASGVAVIRVGGVTEIEMTERKHRVEDALEAVTSARLEGVVPGGGVALVRTSTDLEVEVENDEQRMGVEIVVRAAKEPLRQMSKNAGESPDLITKLVQEQKENYGFDFRAREVVDMYEAGIIDPVKVTKTALANAVSVAGTLITTNYAIIQTK